MINVPNMVINPQDETRLDTKDVWIEELQAKIKELKIITTWCNKRFNWYYSTIEQTRKEKRQWEKRFYRLTHLVEYNEWQRIMEECE